MNEKPLNPKLPGRYRTMSARDFDALAETLGRPIAPPETRSMTPVERRQWQRSKRRPGRPRPGNGARVISLSVEGSLLDKADRAAHRTGLSRAAFFELGLRSALKSITKRAG